MKFVTIRPATNPTKGGELTNREIGRKKKQIYKQN